jgi:hypothetical protein
VGGGGASDGRAQSFQVGGGPGVEVEGGVGDGHPTVTLTLDTYTSVYSEVAAEAAEAAAALVPRVGTPAHNPHTHPVPGTSRGEGRPGQTVGRVGFEPTT